MSTYRAKVGECDTMQEGILPKPNLDNVNGPEILRVVINRLDELQRSNEELTARVALLEGQQRTIVPNILQITETSQRKALEVVKREVLREIRNSIANKK